MIFMGFDDETITHELLSDILFIPIFIRIDRILIVVSQIGVSTREEFYGAGPGFMSTLITKYKDKQSIFVQSIEDKCNLDIYNSDIIQYHNEETTPNKIWKSISIHKNPPSDWSELFKKWYEQNNTIVRFPDILFQIYPDGYQFQEKELDAWDNLIEVYKSGILLLEDDSSFQPNDEGKIFWKNLQKALEANKRGIDRKIRILSIVSENFKYKKLKEELKVGNNTINAAKKHVRLYGPGAPNRSNITQSSYQVDKNGLPILYIRDQKTKLWKKFEESFPNGLMVTTTRAAELFNKVLQYRLDPGLATVKPKAFQQQVVASTVLATMTHWSSSLLLEQLVFSTYDKIAHEVDKILAA
ncbi:hypothetical protein GLOIN_2v1767205 [Rhizophagus clarus]|nr:hypothetical protein GLOIN_2v1767205 [Rhizophagus clarus]